MLRKLKLWEAKNVDIISKRGRIRGECTPDFQSNTVAHLNFSCWRNYFDSNLTQVIILSILPIIYPHFLKYLSSSDLHSQSLHLSHIFFVIPPPTLFKLSKVIHIFHLPNWLYYCYRHCFFLFFLSPLS